MPTGTCRGCGRKTNSTTSNWWHTIDYQPTKCYVAWDGNNKPVKGCAYNEAAGFDKHFANSILRIKDEKR